VLFTFLLTLFINGNISIPRKTLPPFAKFLDPFQGVWNHNTNIESQNLKFNSDIISDNVEVFYDERRIPHIFAQTTKDALYAQGFVEAQNRLFHLYFLSHASAGELSSFLGEVTINYDLEKRRRGMKFAAERAVKAWEKSDNYHYLESYIKGINDYIESLNYKDLPFEFKLFNIKPKKWTVLESALIFKFMSLTLAGRNDDLEFSNLYNLLGQEVFNHLYPETEKVENAVIPDDVIYNFDSIYGQPQPKDAFIKEVLKKTFFENRNKNIGSNSWVLGPQKSVSGSPIFCNDPHLSLGLPSIWIEEHIITPQFNVHGVSFPGLPGIFIGFNEHIAWGETNVGQDVEDLFLIKWVDNEKQKYFLDENQVDVENRIETIKVKGAKSMIDTVKYTHWGPIFHTSLDGKSDLAMRWIAHDKPDMEEYMVFINAMSATNYDEYYKAGNDFICPAQNFGFASNNGDIAMRINGRLPAKFDQDGRFIEYGDKSDNGWSAFIPQHQNPQIINPSRGFVSSANQRSAAKDYPYYFTGKFENFRNRTINDKLKSKPKFSVDEMKVMQVDAYSIKAADLVPLIVNALNNYNLNDNEKAVLDKLSKWNFDYKKDAEEPTIFELFCSNLRTNVWDEILTFNDSIDIIIPKDWRLIELIKQNPNDLIFDHKSTPEIEDANKIIYNSFVKTIDEIDKIRTEQKVLDWGKFKSLDIHHLTRIPILSQLNIEADGCPDAINAKGNSFGPSWRMIVHLEKEPKAYVVYPGGQSGNPFSKYYKNMISDWQKGNYYTVELEKSPLELNGRTTSTIQLIKK